MNNFLNELRKKYSQLPDYNEETVKIRVVKPFIEKLGFLEDWHRYEYPVIKNKSITDITIMKNNKIIFVIEVKKGGNYWIKYEDTQQLLTYLVTKNVEWGIVTTGREYILLNSKINGELKDKQVLKYNLLDNTNDFLTKYLSYLSIFETQITNYFKNLSQFKYYKLQDKNNYLSFSIYNSTILKYFEYLISKFNGYRGLEYLSKEEFKEFIIHDIAESKKRGKHINSIQTVINKYRHIFKLYELFVKYGDINNNPFRFLTEEQMVEGIPELQLSGEDYLEQVGIDKYEQMIDFYDKTRDPERNKLIFLLCLYAGLGRDNIRFIKIDDINFKENTLKVNEVEYQLPKGLTNRLKYYIENVRDKNAKVKYLFDSNYGDYAGEPLSQSSINMVFKKCANYCSESLMENKKIKIYPESIRKVLVRKFFEAGFSIEEIVAITGMELHNIAEYITTDEIKERIVIKSLPDKHPFIDLFKN